MNSFLLIIIALPILEILLIIEVGQAFGSINAIMLIIFTAVLGIYFARIQGFNTLSDGLKNIYQNKTPIFEIISGASIALAAFLLIIPGFITDTLGFVLLIPFTRKILINFFIKKNNFKKKEESDVLEAEIIEDKDDKL
jgi:UPF0716 protein FxsA|tara:strand:+ start:17569 stop:17985 length:417 start_codon:yes stop_codon:yes gene_type:complete